MYWKLTEKIEYDMTEHSMASQKFIFAIMCHSIEEAEKWFYFFHTMGIIHIPTHIKRNLKENISECTKEEYMQFFSSVIS